VVRATPGSPCLANAGTSFLTVVEASRSTEDKTISVLATRRGHMAGITALERIELAALHLLAMATSGA
jgi:hypothetical protein